MQAHKFHPFLIWTILLIFAANVFGQTKSGKIPATTKSAEALEFYEKGFELENRLETDGAEAAYRKAVGLDPTFALAYIRLAMLRDNFDARREYIAEAMKHLDKVSEGERLWILGRNAFYGTRENPDEYGFFEKLVRLYPEDEQANYIFGFLNHHHGGKDLPKAVRHLEKAIRLNPQYALPYNDLAYAYMETGDFENAERIVKRYIELLPGAANPYDVYAEMLMRNGRYAESIEMYEKVLAIDPGYPWAFIGKAANLNFLGRHREARKILPALDKLKLSDYEDRHKWRAKVISYVDEGRLAAAIKVLHAQFESAVGRNDLTQQYESLSRIVRLHFINGQASEGLKAYRRLNDFARTGLKDENLRKRISERFGFYKAYAAYLNGDLASARKFLGRFEKANGPAAADSKLLKAFIFVKEKKYESALEAINGAAADNPYVIFWTGEIYRLNGDDEAAGRWFKKIPGKLEMNDLDFALVRRKTEKRLEMKRF